MVKLDDYLSRTNAHLLNDFKWGSQGQSEFNKFMNLVRKKFVQEEEYRNELTTAVKIVRGSDQAS
ncbi:hypothetical protein SB658_20465 [Bacillus sp. SIMBA_008]|uniref:hypothetical protein n=1 Tax=Bacillus TaxID=1386 RepID=UPI00119AC104|nr:hypothetical protein [Bacillus subtilis]MED1761067.1 hypothetical protein [Bacillus subtilis]TWH24291.1 hypothetical protein L609_000900000690 [Bacillus subtilis J22]UAW07886.1 hypothetical protein [Bacillus phage BUCT082]